MNDKQIWINKELHTQIKILAAKKGMNMRKLVEKAINNMEGKTK